MSVEAISWALKQKIKPSATKFVLVAIANCADGKDAIAWPSIGYLVEATGQDRKTVMAAIAKLMQMGYLRDTGERRGQTKQVIVYQLTQPEPTQDCSDKQSQKRNSTENGTVPDFPLNSTVFPDKQSHISPETVPKTVHGTVKNHHRTVKEPKEAPAARVPTLSVSDLVSHGVDEQVAAEFLAVRKSKRAPLTQIAFDGLVREAGKAKLTLDAALRQCIERGWQSFDAKWVPAKPAGQPSRADRHAQWNEKMNQVLARSLGGQQREIIDMGAIDASN